MNMVMDISHRYRTEQAMNMVMEQAMNMVMYISYGYSTEQAMSMVMDVTVTVRSKR